MSTRRQFLRGLEIASAGLVGAPWAALAQERDNRRQGDAAGVSKFKITDVRAVELRDVGSQYVRVYTDQGLTGTGEMVDTIGAAHIINERLGPSILGRDPLDIEAIYFDFWTWGRIPHGPPPVFLRGLGGPYLSAVSGIEIALWDLAGKALGVPIYRLLGGRIRDRLAIYFWWPRTEAEMREMLSERGARAFKLAVDSITERGHPSKKLDPGKQSHWTVTNAELDEIVQTVQAARDRIGPRVELALECHARYNTETAIQIGRAVAPVRPMWLEEPVTSDNLDAMALVRRSIPVPVACGENIYTRYGFRGVVEKQAAAIIQPDMTKCGGLLETRKIASFAEMYHIPIAPHGTASPLAGMAFAHVCATVPNFLILEWGNLLRNKKLNSLMRNLPDYQDGFVKLSEAPGIGIELNDDAIRENLAPGYRWS